MRTMHEIQAEAVASALEERTPEDEIEAVAARVRGNAELVMAHNRAVYFLLLYLHNKESLSDYIRPTLQTMLGVHAALFPECAKPASPVDVNTKGVVGGELP